MITTEINEDKEEIKETKKPNLDKKQIDIAMEILRETGDKNK